MPPKRYKDLYLREDTYIRLQQLKAALGKRSLNDVIDELLKVFTVSTVNSPVNTVSPTVNTVKLTVSTGKVTVSSPVSTGEPLVSTVKQGEDPNNSELSKRLESLEKGVAELREAVSALEKGFKDFTRKQQDLLNAYTSKTDQVLQRVSQVVELLQQVAEALKQSSAKVSGERQRTSEESERKTKHEKADACERLKKELAIFESDIADRIRDRDRFFTKIARVCNGIVVEGLKERAAIEKSFWQQFLDKLSKIDTSDEEKIKSLLDPLEFRLFTVLKESALIIFDANERRWKLAFKPSTTNTSTSSSSTGSEGSAMATGSDTSNSAEKRYRKRRGEEEDESWLLQYVELDDVEAVKH